MEVTKKVKEVLARIDEPTFVAALELVFESADNLLSPSLLKSKRKLSSGVSELKAYAPYLEIAIKSLRDHESYRGYAPPQGSLDARRSLAIKESFKFNDLYKYTADDFCITDGATGAISSIFEYVKKEYPDAEVVIPCPSYYAFKLCAAQIGIKCVEVNPSIDRKSPMMSIDKIIDSITPDTKIVALTQPSSPAGELYEVSEIMKILNHAKENGYLVLFDEVFSELVLDKSISVIGSDRVAFDMGLLDHIICVKSYSKNLNMPGFRIGYAFSANTVLVKGLAKIQEHRSFFAAGSNFQGILILDSFNYIASRIRQRDKISPKACVREAAIIFKKHRVKLSEDTMSAQELSNYESYIEASRKYYSDKLSTVYKVIDRAVSAKPNTVVAFNTIVRMNNLDDVNQFDFCLNLFIFYGVKIQVGPYFGLTQLDWEQGIGFWVRLSFSRDEGHLVDGIEKLLAFSDDYIINPEKFIHLERQFS